MDNTSSNSSTVIKTVWQDSISKAVFTAYKSTSSGQPEVIPTEELLINLIDFEDLHSVKATQQKIYDQLDRLNRRLGDGNGF